ncbi:hypothetical protein RclHR1_05950013 [Rhizophagus clarus]|uniref:Uncharacterized protein n=1 Tax=Rhizophagus clarus TaxID=94130 RepID=A0A2Z6SHE7_9GLOM|nr:hypothetical protein RclHR1_05950013 [Rhizophagus clarus]
MSQTPNSNTGLHDIIMEESPPAYTPYPNSGEQSMAFGPNRPFGDNATQNTPPQQQQDTTTNQNMIRPQFNQSQFHQSRLHQPPLHQPPLQNYNPQYHNYNNNLVHGVTRPISAVIPVNTQVITTPLRYITNQINHITSPRTNNNFVQMVRPQNNVIYVKPGDSSIGGLLCPRCQGVGKLSNKQLCNRCQGVGRVFN